MQYFSYILFSFSTSKFYKGQTTNPKKRLDRHNNRMEIATKNGAPWVIIWICEKKSRSEALKLEKKLKNLGTKRTIDFIKKYKENIVTQDEFIRLLNEFKQSSSY